MDTENTGEDAALRNVLRFTRKTAEKHGLELNPDEAQLRRLLKSLADNKTNHGKPYCPCKQHFPLQRDADPVCPCPTFRREVETQGHCVCHLFFSPEAAERLRKRPGLLAGVTCPG